LQELCTVEVKKEFDEKLKEHERILEEDPFNISNLPLKDFDAKPNYKRFTKLLI